MQQLGHTGHGSRGKSGGSHISQTLWVFSWEQHGTFIYQIPNPDEDQPLLFFVQSVVQSYLHLDEITTGPSFWKTKVLVACSNRLTGRSH